jgi:hypothetical protein
MANVLDIALAGISATSASESVYSIVIRSPESLFGFPR